VVLVGSLICLVRATEILPKRSHKYVEDYKELWHPGLSMGNLSFEPFDSLALYSQIHVILSRYESGQCLAEELLVKRTKSGNRPSYGWLVTAEAVRIGC
jgi:hypothetical protein